MLQLMGRRKLKVPKFVGEEFGKEYGAVLEQSASQRTMLEMCLKLPCSSEAFSAITEISADYLRTRARLDRLTAEVLADYEEKIREFRADKKQLERENKGLLIELRKSMKIPESKKEDAQTVETKPGDRPKQGRRGAPVGHRGKSRSIPRSFDAEEVVPPPEKCDCGCCQIIPLDESDDKYIEDILPVVKTVHEIKIPDGKVHRMRKNRTLHKVSGTTR